MVNSLNPVTIIGGGLAGLTLGIALRRHDIPVTLWDAGKYPRHRVCGEFLCGRGLRFLSELDLLPGLESNGGCWAESAAFYSAGWNSRRRELPGPAFCLSRYRMDAELAGAFERAGGALRLMQRWSESFAGEGTVRATGRLAQNQVGGLRWFGLKAHVMGVRLERDLEMHLVKNGYVGLCRIEDGRVNVCGLFWEREAVKGLNQRWKVFLSGSPGSHLHQRLGGAEWVDESFTSVAGLCLGNTFDAANECRIGDALTMIPPFTGNGMSMSLESAEHAVEPLVEYSRGKTNWDTARKTIHARCRSAFSGRLFRANLIQHAVTRWHAGSVLMRVLVNSGPLWNRAFEATR